MANRIFDLPETKGEFKLRGVVTGTLKEKFFEIKTTKSGKPMNMVKFGMTTNPDNTVYLDLNGMERDKVYFYKRPEEKGGKGTVKEVAWKKRKEFNEEGFTLIGTKIGLSKKTNDKGKEVNDTHTYTEYDACEVIANNLKDNDNVFVKGNIDYSSFVNDKGEIRRSTKFVPNQVTLTTKPIDFDEEDFEPMNDFQQVIIFMSAELDDSDKDDIKGMIQAKIVTYSTIEDTEFIVRDKKLFSTLKKNLKPYTAILIYGKIKNKVETEEVDEGDVWGESNTFEVANKSFIRELEIVGAKPSTIDTDTYSELAINEALKLIQESKRAKNEFGESDNNWGKSDSSSKTEEDDDELSGWE